MDDGSRLRFLDLPYHCVLYQWLINIFGTIRTNFNITEPLLHVILMVIVGSCSLFGTIFTIVLPVPTLPPLPIHGHPVATISDYWIHTQYMREYYTPKTDKGTLTQQRLFMKLWYPADGTHPSYKKGKRAPYMVIKGDGTSIVEISSIPLILLSIIISYLRDE